MTTTPIRKELESLFKSDKSIRKGKLLPFSGTIGGSNNDGGSPLILDVKLDGEFVADHIFLSNIYYSKENVEDDMYRYLQQHKKNHLKGHYVFFTAIIKKYSYDNQYSLYLTKESTIKII